MLSMNDVKRSPHLKKKMKINGLAETVLQKMG